MTKDSKPLAPPHPAKPGSPGEADKAARDQEYNRKQTGGYNAAQGPNGKGGHKTKAPAAISDDEIREAVQEVVGRFKGKADKTQVVGVIRTVADLLNRDESWVRDPATLDYDPDDLDDPRANPQGARPAPATATRADEHTAPEPDSLGNIVDRKAAQAGINEDEDLTDVPPPDRDAVAAKRAAQKSVDQYGTAGGIPLSRAEHKDDRKHR